MKIRTVAAAFGLAVLLGVSLPAVTPLMPVSEIKPGMVGVGRTVFTGTDLQDFTVHILGVLHNIQGPKRDLILARLEGAGLAESGVAQGMSGSPVYIDGRLIGAVSYSIGSFSKEPIAGITPIAEMKDATAMPRRAARQAKLELPISLEQMTSALTASYARLAPFSDRPADVQSIGIPAATGSQIGAMLRPIATPLAMSGFEPATVDLIAGPFRNAGFAPMVTGGSGDQSLASTAPLREGDAIGVSLVGGDLEMGATGTITHIDGDRLYAFGHPFYNLGPAEFPMTRAYVYTVLPSLMTSFKISTLGETVGTMQQDRATAISGTLGTKPRLIPMKVTLERAGSDTPARTMTFQLVNDQMFTPLLAYVTMYNTLGAYERQFGAATFSVQSRARVRGHGDLSIDDVFTGDSPMLGASTAVAGPLTLLLGNDVEPLTLDGLDVKVTTSEVPRSATIERVWLDEVRPRAGRTIPLKVLTRSYRGEETISTVPIQIPASASGELSIMVSDGRSLNTIEQRELRRSLQPQSVAQLMKVLNETRRNNRIYVRLLTGTPGAVVKGEAMTALPPSVLSVMESDRNGGSFSPIRSATVGEWEVPMDSAISGSRVLTIDVDK
ncbi:MAG: SpoIVB peptidase S55 domain-containing protein [Vicinamibacterales bacterium]